MKGKKKYRFRWLVIHRYQQMKLAAGKNLVRAILVKQYGK